MEFIDQGELVEPADRDCKMLEMLVDSEKKIPLLPVEVVISVVNTSLSSSERLGDSDDKVLSSPVETIVSVDKTSFSSKKLGDGEGGLGKFKRVIP